eukprot:1141536-Pelagomonas_calceolata.AAC.2
MDSYANGLIRECRMKAEAGMPTPQSSLAVVAHSGSEMLTPQCSGMPTPQSSLAVVAHSGCEMPTPQSSLAAVAHSGSEMPTPQCSGMPTPQSSLVVAYSGSGPFCSSLLCLQLLWLWAHTAKGIICQSLFLSGSNLP